MIKDIVKNYKQILYYTLISGLIGIIVGVVDTIFGRILLKLSDIRDIYIIYFLPFLPLAGIVIIFLYKRFSEVSIKGMSLIFETGHGKNEKIPKLLIPLAMISTWITHLFGGSAGREGVAVQLGATVAHSIGRKIKLPKNSRVLLIAGMAAGFAGLFQTPLAATFFAMEVLVAGSILYEALLPALAASYISSYTSHILGLEKFYISINETINFSGTMILKILLISVLFGILGGSFAHVLSYTKKYFSKIINHQYKKIFIIGIGLALAMMAFHFGRYSGLGTNLINSSFNNGQIYTYDWFLKFILTIITLSAGFQGGEVTPLFAIGSSFGVVLAHILGLPPILTAALGYTAVFGSATNTILGPILIGAEVFGTNNILLFGIVCSIAYVFNGNRTIYSLQKKYSYLESIR